MPVDVPIRDASTVVLLRDGKAGIEAWLLTRRTEMVFAAGMSVFPGGRVDDADADLPFATGLGAVAERLGTDEPTARALVGAAVRETYEETGVLLTAPPATLPDERGAVEAGRASFGDLLATHRLTIDPTSLAPWARWVTPAGETTRRYDTRFFVAALPEGAEAQDVTTESSEAGWIPVADAIAQTEAGTRWILPPTLVTLGAIHGFATVTQVMAAAAEQSLAPVRPVLNVTDGRRTITLPDTGLTLSFPDPVRP
jgi:8-oxo-dGTP pyrophosphatase MutT (NUDIX family)